MSALLLPLALVSAEPVAEPVVDSEIEVIGNKLRDWRGSWRSRNGVFSCKTKRSTGDKAIDAIGCDAMRECIAPLVPQLLAIDNTKLPKAEAEQQVNAVLESAKIGDCVFQRREVGITALASARRSKRS